MAKELTAILIISILRHTKKERKWNMNSDDVKIKIVFNGMKIDELISLINYELSSSWILFYVSFDLL